MKLLSFLLLFFSFGTVFSQSSESASNFEMKLSTGDVVELADYKGHVVYISFWASWCHSCMGNFKKYAEIRQQLSNKGVILLNVSIDDSEEKWKKALDRLDISGVNAIVSKDELYPEYDIRSIPLYEIMNKNGKLVYLSDSGRRDVLGQFDNWLRQE